MSNQKDFWHQAITDKSFNFLQELKRQFDFVLIGGWAVYLYTKSLKSKDIDFICSYETLSKLKEKYELFKNERLKKYEFKADGFDVDIYLPHWSELGLPTEEIIKYSFTLEDFKVPEKEKLLILKLFTYSQRKGSLKGEKDKIDTVSLVYFDDIDWPKFNQILEKHKLDYLKQELKSLLENTIEIPELNLNQKKFADFKKKILIKVTSEGGAKFIRPFGKLGD